jgi:hypothetical protein
MAMNRTWPTIGFVLLSLSLATPCVADEPSDRELIEDLRKEVEELRKTVAELNRRLEGQEYGQLPRVEQAKPRPAVEVRHVEPELPKHFRFPVNIERGMAAPVVPMRRAWMR